MTLDWVGDLNRKAGITVPSQFLGAAGAANKVAGTNGLELVGALNKIAGTSGVEFHAALRAALAGAGGNPGGGGDTGGGSTEPVWNGQADWGWASAGVRLFNLTSTYGEYELVGTNVPAGDLYWRRDDGVNHSASISGGGLNKTYFGGLSEPGRHLVLNTYENGAFVPHKDFEVYFAPNGGTIDKPAPPPAALLSDRFNRTGTLNGTTAETGQSWMADPIWGADGSSAVSAPTGTGNRASCSAFVANGPVRATMTVTVPAAGNPLNAAIIMFGSDSTAGVVATLGKYGSSDYISRGWGVLPPMDYNHFLLDGERSAYYLPSPLVSGTDVVFAVEWDGTTARAYVDGTFQSEWTLGAGYASTGAQLQVGFGTYTGYTNPTVIKDFKVEAL